MSIWHWIHVVGFHFITHIVSLISMMTIPAIGQFSVNLSKWFAWYAWKLIDFLFMKIDHIILTMVGFGFISQWLLAQLISNHKKVLLWCLLHLHAKFQLILTSGFKLPCKHVRPSTLIIRCNLVIPYQIPTKIGTMMHFNKPFMCANLVHTYVFYSRKCKCAKQRRN